MNVHGYELESDVISLLSRDREEATVELQEVVREFDVMIEILDETDDDGHVQIRIHSDFAAELNGATSLINRELV
jgi:hypothetical protein